MESKEKETRHKIENFKNVKGKHFILLSNSNGHNYPLNQILTFKKNGTGTNIHDAAEEISYGNTLVTGDVLLINSVEEYRKYLEEEKKKIKEKEEALEKAEALGISLYQFSKFKKTIEVLRKYNLDKDTKFVKDFLESLE